MSEDGRICLLVFNPDVTDHAAIFGLGPQWEIKQNKTLMYLEKGKRETTQTLRIELREWKRCAHSYDETRARCVQVRGRKVRGKKHA